MKLNLLSIHTISVGLTDKPELLTQIYHLYHLPRVLGFSRKLLFYLLPFLFNIAKKVIFMPTKGSLFMCSINMYSLKNIAEEKKKGATIEIFEKNKKIDKSNF